MQISISSGNAVALFGAMFILALIPSVSVLTVSARSAAYGFVHGVLTTFGIVVGDIVFIIIAIFGLAVLVEAMGDLFVWLKYLSAAYLLWLGASLWRTRSVSAKVEGVSESSLLSSFLMGLFITLGDQKAILFYLVFFPAFIDLAAIGYLETGIVIVIATLAIGIAKLGYAFLADRTSVYIGSKAGRIINRVAGTVMIIAGLFLAVQA